MARSASGSASAFRAWIRDVRSGGPLAVSIFGVGVAALVIGSGLWVRARLKGRRDAAQQYEPTRAALPISAFMRQSGLPGGSTAHRLLTDADEYAGSDGYTSLVEFQNFRLLDASGKWLGTSETVYFLNTPLVLFDVETRRVAELKSPRVRSGNGWDYEAEASGRIDRRLLIALAAYKTHMDGQRTPLDFS